MRAVFSPFAELRARIQPRPVRDGEHPEPWYMINQLASGATSVYAMVQQTGFLTAENAQGLLDCIAMCENALEAAEEREGANVA